MTDSKTSRCAVTGANGYLGSRVVRRFRADGWEVVPLSRSGASSVSYSLDSPPPAKALENVDALIHCAYDFSPRTESAMRKTNVDGSVQLLKTARELGVKTIVFISSMAAYDGCKSQYGSRKLAVEREAAKLGAVIVRPGMIYGKNAGGILASLRKAASTLPVVPLIGDGKYPLFTAHEEDLCELLFDLAMDRVDRQPIISATASQTVPFRQIVRDLASAAGRNPFLLPIPWRIPFYGLRAIEAMGVKIGFRSDSIVSLVESNPHPVFAMEERFRNFSVADL